jgi:hypothetical protein
MRKSRSVLVACATARTWLAPLVCMTICAGAWAEEPTKLCRAQALRQLGQAPTLSLAAPTIDENIASIAQKMFSGWDPGPNRLYIGCATGATARVYQQVVDGDVHDMATEQKLSMFYDSLVKIAPALGLSGKFDERYGPLPSVFVVGPVISAPAAFGRGLTYIGTRSPFNVLSGDGYRHIYVHEMLGHGVFHYHCAEAPCEVNDKTLFVELLNEALATTYQYAYGELVRLSDVGTPEQTNMMNHSFKCDFFRGRQ